MKKIFSIKIRILGIICFFLAGIISLVSKEYILGLTFILAAISYLIALKQKNVIK
ncbi:hypothetical protein [Clostridium perfringens]|jgi:hypothetical protein|uniref:hypothetical protein n=1 Tax=Clostridium perfringens TaxID=1502 RepID=UPI0024BD4ED7|nr:hypothetical protein [Clostridium perfringens]